MQLRFLRPLAGEGVVGCQCIQVSWAVREQTGAMEATGSYIFCLSLMPKTPLSLPTLRRSESFQIAHLYALRRQATICRSLQRDPYLNQIRILLR